MQKRHDTDNNIHDDVHFLLSYKIKFLLLYFITMIHHKNKSRNQIGSDF